MEIIERAAAQAAGLKVYFTGRPCVNGHVAKRYATSGACADCIRQSQDAIRAAYAASPGQAAVRARYAEAGTFAREVVPVRLRVPLSTFPSLQSIAAAMLRARFPAMADSDLTCAPQPTGQAGGTAMLRFLVHSADEPILRTMADNECRRYSAASLATAGAA